MQYPAEYVNHLSWTEGADSIVFCSQFTLHAEMAFNTFTTREIIMANKRHCLYYNIQKQVHMINVHTKQLQYGKKSYIAVLQYACR